MMIELTHTQKIAAIYVSFAATIRYPFKHIPSYLYRIWLTRRLVSSISYEKRRYPR